MLIIINSSTTESEIKSLPERIQSSNDEALELWFGRIENFEFLNNIVDSAFRNLALHSLIITFSNDAWVDPYGTNNALKINAIIGNIAEYLGSNISLKVFKLATTYPVPKEYFSAIFKNLAQNNTLKEVALPYIACLPSLGDDNDVNLKSNLSIISYKFQANFGHLDQREHNYFSKYSKENIKHFARNKKLVKLIKFYEEFVKNNEANYHLINDVKILNKILDSRLLINSFQDKEEVVECLALKGVSYNELEEYINCHLLNFYTKDFSDSLFGMLPKNIISDILKQTIDNANENSELQLEVIGE